VTLSFYVRRRIGHATWRRIHYLSFVVFLMVTVHGLMSGTDTARAGVRVMYQTAGWSVLGLGIYRALAVWVFPAFQSGSRSKGKTAVPSLMSSPSPPDNGQPLKAVRPGRAGSRSIG
jgi:DMSO/TMAO reductase YedYZ heme-binding membrane subunit